MQLLQLYMWLLHKREKLCAASLPKWHKAVDIVAVSVTGKVLKMRILQLASLLTAAALAPSVAHAERYDLDIRKYNQVIRAIILDDIIGQEQARRDAARYPYASAGYGPIADIRTARDACAADVLNQLGQGVSLSGVPQARPMATGWEVEGGLTGTSQGDSFVCSVRNGSVSGVIIR